MIYNFFLPKEMHSKAVEIFSQAFQNKYGTIFKTENEFKKFISILILQKKMIYAYKDGILYGLLIYSSKESKTHTTPKNMIQTFGFFRGMKRFVKLAPFHEKIHKGEMHLDFMCVSEEARGRGIGTLLMQEAIEIAQREKYKELTLAVIDTNEQAKKLYETLGFKTLKKVETTPLNKLYHWDYKTVYSMVKKID